jgi:signal transduction histidine kinase/CheY-like chemotaxis protein
MDHSAVDDALSAARATEERLKRALRVAQIGSWEWDVAADTLVWTDELYEMFDVDPRTFEASYAAYLGLVDTEDRGRVDGIVQASFVSGEPFVFDHRVPRRDGSVRTLHAWGEVQRDREGRTVKLVGTCQDVTEVRGNEARLRDSEERAQSASRQKSQFLANMSHEIRTPLNGVVGMTELLAESALTPTQREHVNALHGAATSLLHLLNDVLDVSKIEAGKVTFESVDCDLPALVAEMVALFRVVADAKGVQLTGDVDGSTAQCVRTDPARLKQILGNLVGNAVKFTERGTVELRVRAEAGRLVFTIADTGIGIAPADHARVMSPFEQGDPSTTRRFGGTGLGLAISRDLTELMGGTITFTSEPNVGTTFVVELPYQTGDAPRVRTLTPRPKTSVTHRAGRVLVADDAPVNQVVARAMLERLGWSVEIVDNGQQALDALERESFDIVVLDCQMPVLDGFDTARAIRSMPEPARGIAILALTGSALDEDRLRCLDAGMDDYITKPISIASLDDAMGRVLSARPRVVHG